MVKLTQPVAQIGSYYQKTMKFVKLILLRVLTLHNLTLNLMGHKVIVLPQGTFSGVKGPDV